MARILLVDDDHDFCMVMKTALSKRGYEVTTAHSAEEVNCEEPYDYAVIDLKMPGSSGLKLIPVLATQQPHLKILMLTGYASIATAVEAMKLGAWHYLAKPVHADDIVQALEGENTETDIEENPTPASMREWEHIQQVLAETDFNISEAARKLGMHRRTLQRKLQKRPYR